MEALVLAVVYFGSLILVYQQARSRGYDKGYEEGYVDAIREVANILDVHEEELDNVREEAT